MGPANRLEGVIAPNLTPFNADLSVASDLYLAHARHLLDTGCVGLAPFGTTGEALSLGMQERLDLLQVLVDGGIDPARLIPGTGLTNLPDTARLTQAAVDLGCAGAMVLPPFYYKEVPDDGLFAYFARLIEAVDRPALRLYLYHIPQVAGVGLPVDLVRRLHTAFPEQIVGVKDSSGQWENTAALLGIDGLIVYPGAELPLLQALALGAPGCITATANLNAGRIAEVIRLFRTGQTEAAARLHEEVKRVRLLLQSYAPIPAQKRLLALSGDPRWATLRPPLPEMDVEAGRALAAELAELGAHALPGAA
ncbi:MAG: dihydrodipicolinate synthase family protein [Pseudomonadota bacterium]